MGDVTRATRYRRRPDLLSRAAPGLVVLARVDGRSVSLTGSAESVWRLLDRGRTLGELADDLGSIYDAEPSRIAADVEPVLSELVALGFVVTDA